ncbi:MAG: hypothetical protein LUD69_03485 [Oscillospiraceae bacterium]|nr:hypothetical protein [Oscillospiraceae bacterium]
MTMKKVLIFLLTVLLLLGLTACGSGEEADLSNQVITRTDKEESSAGTDSETEETEDSDVETSADAAADAFSFEIDGVTLTPGAALDLTVLPDASSVYTVESCAVEGTDNVYTYDAFEVTAYDDGSGEVIYSIYLTDPNITTAEGLALGDDLNRVTELYGSDYAENDTAVVYTKGDTQLSIILQDEVVISIEYLLVL